MVASIPQHARAGLGTFSPGDPGYFMDELTSQIKDFSKNVDCEQKDTNLALAGTSIQDWQSPLPLREGNLQVKHTFFEFVDAIDQSQTDLSSMRRASSDSAICKLAGAC